MISIQTEIHTKRFAVHLSQPYQITNSLSAFVRREVFFSIFVAIRNILSYAASQFVQSFSITNTE